MAPGKFAPWLIIASALVVPGSGHVILGKPTRGLMYLIWIMLFGFLTFHLSPNQTSFLGKISGGLAIWVLSILEVCRLVSLPKSI